MDEHFSIKYGNRHELSITLYLQSEIYSGYLSIPDATFLISTSLPPEPSILYYFELNSGIGPVANLAEEGL